MQTSSHSSSRVGGALAALTGFVVWGCFPVYWKALHFISATEAITHRVVWSCLCLLPILAWQGRLGELWATLRNTRALGLGALKGVLLSANWLIYIWAVNRGQVVESSLGYFLVPLVNAALGRLLLHERVTRLQLVSIFLAAIGVGLLLFRVGHVPWVAFGLAATWSVYGLLKKRSSVGPIVGLTLETLVLFPPCAALLAIWASHGEGGLGHTSWLQQLLILSTGVVTAVPLVLFAHGAQTIRLMTLGLLQFVTPTVQFLIGVLVYKEAFDDLKLQAFSLIWVGLVVYCVDAVLTERAKRAAQVPETVSA